ncbi:MAG TPA: type II toxin-antitoxin system RelE/ParE family toxin [Spirochaetota bacterium]|nr:type II toxin-antitoxin system RelE/ParE family toxin [Spirochaetota bacterium]
MDMLYTKKFLKDVEYTPDKKVRQNIEDFINSIKNCTSLSDLPGIQKMTGYDNYYRLRIGDYRIGFKLENNTVTLLRFKHRKDIYSVFP